MYVDDIRLVDEDIDKINEIKAQLQEQLKMTDMGEASLVLGMQVTRDRQKQALTSTPGYGAGLSAQQPEETKLNDVEWRPEPTSLRLTCEPDGKVFGHCVTPCHSISFLNASQARSVNVAHSTKVGHHVQHVPDGSFAFETS